MRNSISTFAGLAFLSDVAQISQIHPESPAATTRYRIGPASRRDTMPSRRIFFGSDDDDDDDDDEEAVDVAVRPSPSPQPLATGTTAPLFSNFAFLVLCTTVSLFPLGQRSFENIYSNCSSLAAPAAPRFPSGGSTPAATSTKSWSSSMGFHHVHPGRMFLNHSHLLFIISGVIKAVLRPAALPLSPATHWDLSITPAATKASLSLRRKFI